MLRYLTAGESHGPCLTMIIDGVPAGFPIQIEKINHDLWRRQQGYGRGGRMLIEKDEAQVRSGIRWGETIGAPVAPRNNANLPVAQNGNSSLGFQGSAGDGMGAAPRAD